MENSAWNQEKQDTVFCCRTRETCNNRIHVSGSHGQVGEKVTDRKMMSKGSTGLLICGCWVLTEPGITDVSFINVPK